MEGRVESNTNWADGTSQEGLSCSWGAPHGFKVRHVQVPSYTWDQRWEGAGDQRWGNPAPFLAGPAASHRKSINTYAHTTTVRTHTDYVTPTHSIPAQSN